MEGLRPRVLPILAQLCTFQTWVRAPGNAGVGGWPRKKSTDARPIGLRHLGAFPLGSSWWGMPQLFPSFIKSTCPKPSNMRCSHQVASNPFLLGLVEKNPKKDTSNWFAGLQNCHGMMSVELCAILGILGEFYNGLIGRRHPTSRFGFWMLLGNHVQKNDFRAGEYCCISASTIRRWENDGIAADIPPWKSMHEPTGCLAWGLAP